ncbi:MAG: ATP-binding protein [Ignavibacteria bacterium]|nr:ATP-binding protein [Ignavibacteria bacterium]
MKNRLKLFSKFTLLYSFLFLAAIILLSKVIDVSNETLFFSSAVILICYGVTFAFIKFELFKPLQELSKITTKLSAKNKNAGDLENEITDVNEILAELVTYRDAKSKSLYIYNINNLLINVAERLSNDLQTAKTFKVNRNEFLGNVTHELRTPIFAIQLSLETLLDGAMNDKSVSEDFLNRAIKQTYRLKDLVDDLISISKLEAGMKMSKRYFRVNDMIKRTIDDLQGIANKKNITIEFNPGSSNGVSVFGDEERLKQVMINLIDNAVKYTNSDGVIKVTTEMKPKEVTIAVEDNGIGIPKVDLPRVFERFYRVDKTRSRDVGGSGLGLSIVKHILESHKSSIKVESEENKGTRFEFNLMR